MSKHFDFDKFIEEKKSRQPDITVKAFGEIWTLPSDIPYDVVLEMARMQKMKATDEVDEMVVFDLANSLCGEDNVKEWRKRGIGVNGMMMMFQNIYRLYMTETNEEAKEIENKNP